ncbi:hypothetical protein CI1B_48990 [Bradyrhizobium ivorense]|uniref:Uncharacterized protein n=1 Tax=Bradyrhizobium ivorense TaxID=2511166 RepID=A0A508TFU4_9BRAD|nr:hypothetical protein [Bradyrhizobium ivorense]VIO73294.1 hypothetical protein CI1B_48990 [Bradyrhizobium ivorense]
MQRERLALIAIAVSVAAMFSAAAACAQGLQDFGLVGLSPLWKQIRDIKDKAEVKRIENTRVCNISVPLAGSANEAADASESDWKATLASYDEWEADYQTRSLFRQPLVQAGDEKGKQKYIRQRKAGTSQRTMQLFAYAFYLRAMYRNGKYAETASAAESAIQKFHLSPSFHQLDLAETSGTYLTDETNANAIFLYARLGRITGASTDADKFLSIVRYLDIRDELLSTIKLGFFIGEDDDNDILESAAGLATAAMSGALGVLPRAAIKASWIQRDGGQAQGFVVFRGKRSNTFQISFGGGGEPPPPANDNKSAASPNGPERPMLLAPGRNSPASGGLGSYANADILSAGILAASEAKAAYRRFVDSRLVEYSSSEMALFDIQKDGDSYSISFAKPGGDKTGDPAAAMQRFTLQSAEMKALGGTGTLPADHPMSPFIDQLKEAALVEYSNPFMSADNDNEFRASADQFSFGLQRALPKKQVYRDSLSDQTKSIVSNLGAHLVGDANDYVAIIADTSFKVTDYKIVQNIRSSLIQAGIPIQKGVQGDNKEKNVILITAHSDEEFAKFVDALGGAGSFKNSYVIVNSCETPVTRRIAEKITGQYGAKAAFVYEGTIPAENVSQMIESMAKTVKEKSKQKLVDFLRGLTAAQGLTGIWSVS